MYLIIVATNRKEAVSKKIAAYYQNLLQEHQTASEILDLENLPADFAFSALYENSGKNEVFNQFQKQVDAATKLIFVLPEYNGSFPGIIKTFIDGLRYPDSFKHKKAILVGLSAGVQGNATGLSHFGDILAYMGCHTMAQRVQLGLIKQHFDGQNMNFPIYKKLIDEQVANFVKF